MPENQSTGFRKLFSYPLEAYIAVVATLGIATSLTLEYALGYPVATYRIPLLITVYLGGAPLVFDLIIKLFKRQFGSDLLAGISIVTAVALDQYLAGAFVVLMLSGGETLEEYAVGRASSALNALAKRMPTVAHRKSESATIADVQLSDVRIDDIIVIYPHEICPVDGVVVEGRGVMDESYLTGEPFEMNKTPGSEVISGAVNGESALTIRATKLAEDSRYAKIMEVMRESEKSRPQLRRLGDQLGAWYTPVAVTIAVVAWGISGDPVRFLATLVIATPCPLLIAIPTAIIGAVSVAARRAIVIRDPSALERLDETRTIILDKTGTMTFGRPQLTDEMYANPGERARILAYAASVEQYSKHPLAAPIRDAIDMARVPLLEVAEVHERPGEGMRGLVDGHKVEITGRSILKTQGRLAGLPLPPQGTGLECIILINDEYAATYRFHDAPREGSRSFIEHLGEKHKYDKVMIVSGDREPEVRYLAELVGITDIHAEKTPKKKSRLSVRKQRNRKHCLSVTASMTRRRWRLRQWVWHLAPPVT